MTRLFARFLVLIVILHCVRDIASAQESEVNPVFSVAITVDASRLNGEHKPIYRFFGADEPNYAYMKNGKKLLGELGRLGKAQVFFRAHHLLTSGDGAFALKFGSTSAYKEDAAGNAVYDWTINDKIFDTYLECGIKPYVQIGFMPESLSTHPEDYPHHPSVNQMVKVDAGQAYPPKDYDKWRELCYQWTKHCVDRYGVAEVEQWYWEVWNEPNIFYWVGSRDEFFKLHDYAVDGVRRALPNAKVGGPETADGPGGEFLRKFLEHCARGKNYATGKIGTPLDFIAFHAKGSPKFMDGHVRMNMAHQLTNIDDAFEVIASFPEFKQTPIVIGESDPEGCAACRRPEDAYRNGTMYSSYTAASFPRVIELADKHGVNLEGALTWAFTFEGQPPFAGFRQLASDGIDHPVLNIFRMFGKMGGQRIGVTSSSGFNAERIRKENVIDVPDVSAQASLEKNKLAVLVWHYHDDDLPGKSASVSLAIEGLPIADGGATLTHYRVDAEHSNAYEVWKQIGSPVTIPRDQVERLEKAGKLGELHAPLLVDVRQGTTKVQMTLPRQAVSLLVLSW